MEFLIMVDIFVFNISPCTENLLSKTDLDKLGLLINWIFLLIK